MSLFASGRQYESNPGSNPSLEVARLTGIGTQPVRVVSAIACSRQLYCRRPS